MPGRLETTHKRDHALGFEIKEKALLDDALRAELSSRAFFLGNSNIHVGFQGDPTALTKGPAVLVAALSIRPSAWKSSQYTKGIPY